MLKIIIDEENQNKRIDLALANLSPFSRSMIQKLIYAEKISVSGQKIQKPNEITILGQEFEILEPTPNVDHIEPEKGNLEILFEDEHIIVLNKEANSVVHPGANNRSGTLVNFLAHHTKSSEISAIEHLGVAHRLDKGVSGCIIFAKTTIAHQNLVEQFQNRTIQKEYIAICYGNYFNSNKIRTDREEKIQTCGIMEDWIIRSQTDRKKMTIIKDSKFIGRKFQNENYDQKALDSEKNPGGKFCIMEFQVQNCFYINEKIGFLTKIQCFPKTGRMHQIRVQLASRNLPIIGDEMYGKIQHKEILDILGKRIGLHAKSIEFQHPITKETMKITTELPKEFETIIETYSN